MQVLVNLFWHAAVHQLQGKLQVPVLSFFSTASSQNRARNRAQNREPQNGNNFNDFYKFSIQMGWEYLHWVDLRLIKLMEVVI